MLVCINWLCIISNVFFFQDEGHTFFVSAWSITANGKQPRFIRAICICILGTSEALDKFAAKDVSW